MSLTVEMFDAHYILRGDGERGEDGLHKRGAP
jgi:hypothetical protein